jgi:hypothetical protein
MVAEQKLGHDAPFAGVDAPFAPRFDVFAAAQ